MFTFFTLRGEFSAGEEWNKEDKVVAIHVIFIAGSPKSERHL